MQRFFIDLQEQRAVGEVLELVDREIIHQISAVLRMRPGEKCVFLDQKGNEHVAALLSSTPKIATFKILEKTINKNEPKLAITLIQGLPKKMEVFEWVLQKGTEVGVTSFVPFTAEYSQRRDLQKGDRLLRIVKEAAEQAERGIVPKLELASWSLKETLGNLQKQCEKIIALDGRDLEKRISLKTFVQSLNANQSAAGSCASLGIIIGPEGGLSPKEIAYLEEAKIPLMHMGSRILRTETAGVCASHFILNFLES